MKTRVVIGIPSYGNGKALFWRCLEELRAYSHKHNCTTIIVNMRGCYVEHARNQIVSKARNQNKNIDYLFWLDDDMTFARDTLVRLLAHKKDIVGVNYYRKQSPHLPVAAVLDPGDGRMLPIHMKPGEIGLELVQCLGTGICLTRMDVYERIEFPWFFNEYVRPANIDQYGDVVEGHILVGEDTRFFMRANMADIDVWCDFSLMAGHIGDREYCFEDFERCDAQRREAE